MSDGIDDGVDYRCGLLDSTFQQQPSWALRHIPPHHSQGYDADPSQKEHRSPMLLIHKQSKQTGHGASQVPSAINADIDPSPIIGRHELIDAGEDSCELAANAEDGKEGTSDQL